MRATWGLLHIREGDLDAGIDGYRAAQALAAAQGNRELANRARQKMSLELARHYLRIGTPKMLLRTHELLGWSGALALVVHGGIHFNALIPWVALTAMLVVVASGLTGQFLLKQARADHKAREAALLAQGVPRLAVDQELLAHALLVRSMQRWRTVHLPLTMVFCGFAVVHIVATVLLWGWR